MYHSAVDLLFDWFGISCMTTDNICFYLWNRLIQTGQTGDQQYSDTSPFSIPWFKSLVSTIENHAINQTIFLRCLWSKPRKARSQYHLFGFKFFLPLKGYSDHQKCPKGLYSVYRFLYCKIINFLILRLQIAHLSKLALNGFSQHYFYQFLDSFILLSATRYLRQSQRYSHHLKHWNSINCKINFK